MQASAESDGWLRGWALRGFLLASVSAFLAVGFISLYSSTQGPQAATSLLSKQVCWLGVGLTCGFLLARIDLDRLRRLWLLVAGVTVGLLLSLFALAAAGSELVPVINGAQRWIVLGFASIQVSEFAKLGFLVVFAHYLARYQGYIRFESDTVEGFLRGFVVPMAILAIPVALIGKQPDYSAAALLAVVGGILLFLAGAHLRFVIPTGVVCLTAFGYLLWDSPERQGRLLAFVNVEGTRLDEGYQLWQSLLAFNTGGITGVGPGNGRQQYSWLPEAHTDFIFAIIGEELGLIVSGTVVLLFLALFLALAFRVREVRDPFRYYLGTGALLLFSIQALLNLGVVTGLLPTTGLALPFISYGGSNLVVMCSLMGILWNCLDHSEASPVERPMEV